MVPGKLVKGPGGAMDLVAGIGRIIVLMDHVSRDGTAKFRKACMLPLTGTNVVDMIITNLAVFERANRRSFFALTEIAPGSSRAELRALTEAHYLD
jgi:3-oxoacid CoA-transferase subunit B